MTPARIYLDYHATTPLDERVLQCMLPYLTDTFGNASSIGYADGLKARAAVDQSRSEIATAIGARPEEIVFTSGATESNNLAIFGVTQCFKENDRHFVTTAIEHSSVLEAGAEHRRRGGTMSVVAVDAQGRVDPQEIERAMSDSTALVSVMHANNEIGSIQDLATVSTMCRRNRTILHTDAAPSIGKVPFHVDELGVDLASISGHKLYGPKGVGALYVRSLRPRVQLRPQLFGGGQQRGIRPGTLNVPGVVGLAAAVTIAVADMHEDSVRSAELRNRLLDRLSRAYDGIVVNGPDPRATPADRLPGNINLWFPGIDAVALLRDARIVEASTGSACTESSTRPSHVLLAIDPDERRARESIRLCVGRTTTADDIDRAVVALSTAACALRRS